MGKRQHWLERQVESLRDWLPDDGPGLGYQVGRC